MAHLPVAEEWQGEKGDSVTSSESYRFPYERGLYAPTGWGNGSRQSRFVERGERLNGRKVPGGWLRAANRLRHSERHAVAVRVRRLVAFFRQRGEAAPLPVIPGCWHGEACRPSQDCDLRDNLLGAFSVEKGI